MAIIRVGHQTIKYDTNMFLLTDQERHHAFNLLLHSNVYAQVTDTEWSRLSRDECTRELLELLSRVQRRMEAADEVVQ